jgi:hypothetical protein
MKSLVFVTLFAVAFSALQDKFRASGVTVMGNSGNWVFFPLNNEDVPTFQLMFPYMTSSVSNSNNGITYTIVIDHLAEVVPAGGMYRIVADTKTDIALQTRWTLNSWDLTYDGLDELVTFNFVSSDHVELISLHVHPGSDDAIVDIYYVNQEYGFTSYVLQQPQLALFYKIAASTGEAPIQGLPLSVTYEAMTFSLEADFMFLSTSGCTKKRSVPRHALPIPTLLQSSTTDHTSASIWISNGNLAAVFGVVPEDIDHALDHCIMFQTSATLGMNLERPNGL